MNRIRGLLCVLAAVCVGAGARPALGEKLKLKLKWSQEFAKSIDWYVRTSAGIIVAKAGKEIAGIDEVEGAQLWSLPEAHQTIKWYGSMNEYAQRARDVLEVPGTGILLLNHVKFPGDGESRLVAINLLNGKRLWDQPEIDELMTAVPLYASGEAVLVTRRSDTKRLAVQMIAAAGAAAAEGVATGGFGYFSGPYPYHFELMRIDLATGRAKWDEEYHRVFTPGTARISTSKNELFLYFSNHLMSSFNLENGKLIWEDGEKSSGNVRLPIPVKMANGSLVYSSEYVRGVDPATQKEKWSIEEIGKVTGIVIRDDLVIALGEKKMAAVDLENGKERWRIKTHGQTTNLLWSKESDSLIYSDGKGLHAVEAATGRTILDTPLRVESWPRLVRLTGPETVVTIAARELGAYNFKSGKKLFAEGQLTAFFRSSTTVDNWPMPDDGEEFEEMTRMPSDKEEWEGLRKSSVLDAQALKLLEESATSGEFLDAFETVTEQTDINGKTTIGSKIWWIDPQTNQQMEITPAALHHDVDRRAHLVFATKDKQIWAATFSPADAPAAQAGASK